MQKIFRDFIEGFYCDNMMKDNTDIPKNESTIGCIKSVPGIEIPSILDKSDHSMMSDKTFDTAIVGDGEIYKPTEKISKVKALIVHNNKLIQERQLNARANNYESKKKSFDTACKNLAKSYENCVNMKGDMDQVDDVNSFVRYYQYYF